MKRSALFSLFILVVSFGLVIGCKTTQPVSSSSVAVSYPPQDIGEDNVNVLLQGQRGGVIRRLADNTRVIHNNTVRLYEEMEKLRTDLKDANSAVFGDNGLATKVQANTDAIASVSRDFYEEVKAVASRLENAIDHNRRETFAGKSINQMAHPRTDIFLITFSVGEYEIKGDVKVQTDGVIKAIQNKNLLITRVIGAASVIGTATDNLKLARERARRGYAYLIKNASDVVIADPKDKVIHWVGETIEIGVKSRSNQTLVIKCDGSKIGSPTVADIPVAATRSSP